MVDVRDLGNAKSCCFTIQPITALNFIFLLSHRTGERKTIQGALTELLMGRRLAI